MIKIKIHGLEDVSRSGWMVGDYNQRLLENGIQVVSSGHDVYIVNMKKDVLLSSDPYICVDTTDASRLNNRFRYHLKNNNCLAYLTNTSLRNPLLHNENTYNSDWIHRNTTVRGKKTSLIPIENPQKIRTCLPFMHLTELFYRQNTNRRPNLNERKNDVFFAGTIYYGTEVQSGPPTAHRLLALKTMQELNGISFDLRATRTADGIESPRLSINPYMDLMRNSKICVSPWGWAAWSRRDIQAMLSGSIVVKPRCTEVVMSPDIYHPDGDWLYWCKPDFSDLQEVVDKILESIRNGTIDEHHHLAILPERIYESSSLGECTRLIADAIKSAVATKA